MADFSHQFLPIVAKLNTFITSEVTIAQVNGRDSWSAIFHRWMTEVKPICCHIDILSVTIVRAAGTTCLNVMLITYHREIKSISLLHGYTFH